MSGEDHPLKQFGAYLWQIFVGSQAVGVALGYAFGQAIGAAIGWMAGAGGFFVCWMISWHIQDHENKKGAKLAAARAATPEAKRKREQEALAAEQSAAEQESLARWIAGPEGVVPYDPGEANPASIRTPGGAGGPRPRSRRNLRRRKCGSRRPRSGPAGYRAARSATPRSPCPLTHATLHAPAAAA